MCPSYYDNMIFYKQFLSSYFNIFSSYKIIRVKYSLRRIIFANIICYTIICYLAHTRLLRGFKCNIGIYKIHTNYVNSMTRVVNDTFRP